MKNQSSEDVTRDRWSMSARSKRSSVKGAKSLRENYVLSRAPAGL